MKDSIACLGTETEGTGSGAFEPKVVAFCCTYCAYTAADLAGAMRLEYPPNVRVVQVLCSGKVEAEWLLRAFEEGADAVYVAGCALGDCHFLEGNRQALRTVAYAKRLLAEVGLEPERLEFFHIPASAGTLFAQRAREMTDRARRLGPSPLRSKQAVESRKLVLPPDPHPPLPPAQLGRRIRESEEL
ncbi:MAG TPA: hydrogenase iron-sulfur subunit [Thermoguttaceae bacterium]|nr:hydrogenase iron-sulfur subunit [Thermoguttaceae bacterium]